MKKIKTSVIAISVLLLIFSTGCEKPGYQVKIIPGNNIYSLLLSSAPGLPLAPGVEKGEKPDDTHYEWSAGKGSFLEVGAGYKIIDLGSDISNDGGTVYWSLRNQKDTLVGKIIITLKVVSNLSGETIATDEKTMTKDEQGMYQIEK